MSERLSRDEVYARGARFSEMERERRANAAASIVQDVRALAASASPRIRPDKTAIVAELKRMRSFEAHRKMQALALDVELIDHIIELLEK